MKRHSAAVLFALCGVIALGTKVAHADVTYADDLIVQGALCLGFDCVNDETFTSEFKLKENNTRINFIDQTAVEFDALIETSEYNLAGAMNGAWRIDANESNAGGRSAFIIRQQSAIAYPALSNGTAVDYECSAEGATAVGVIAAGEQVETQSWAYNPLDPAATDCLLLSSEIRLDGLILEGNSISSGAALGRESVPVDGTISIGSAQILRRLSNIAEALQDTDLVIKSQFEVDILPEVRLSELRSQLRQLDRQVTRVEQELGLVERRKKKSGSVSFGLILALGLLGLRRRH